MSYYIRNLARDPSSRTKRALRPGRKTGFLLKDGRRVRRQGLRGMEIGKSEVLDNLERIATGIEEGYVELCDATGAALDSSAVLALGGQSSKKAKAVVEVKVEDKVTVELEEVEVKGGVWTEDGLKSKSRKELDDIAADSGIDPSGYSRKGDLIAALLGG